VGGSHGARRDDDAKNANSGEPDARTETLQLVPQAAETRLRAQETKLYSRGEVYKVGSTPSQNAQDTTESWGGLKPAHE